MTCTAVFVFVASYTTVGCINYYSRFVDIFTSSHYNILVRRDTL